MQDSAPEGLAEQFNLAGFIGGLVGDLEALRAGTISVRDAQARAELARQILRGVHYVVLARRHVEGAALPAPKPVGRPTRRGEGT